MVQTPDLGAQAVQHQEGFFSGRDGIRLFWRSAIPSGAKAQLAVIHGYGDHSGRYGQMTSALAADGFAVHALDYRGHGLAGGRRGDCQNWSDYIADVDLFLKRVQGAAQGQKCFVFAHSHGALIALHQRKRLLDFQGLILSSPYLGLAREPAAPLVVVAKVLEKVLPGVHLPAGISQNQITSDPERQAADQKDPLQGIRPTPRWFFQSRRAQAQALTFGPDVVTPLLVLCAGEDQIASTPTTRRFFETIAAKDKQYKEYPGMQHEVWNERGREQVWRDISLWIQERL